MWFKWFKKKMPFIKPLKENDIANRPYHGGPVFNVIGAGVIDFGPNAFSRCKGVYGFAFGCSWGRYGYTGGVIGREEALRMANFIIEKCAEVTPEMKAQEQADKIAREKDMKEFARKLEGLD